MTTLDAIVRLQPINLLRRPLVGVAAAALLLFLLIPVSFHHKAHMALHGLCAQRPSHSYWLGHHRLPFDARMTGIYLGFGAAALLLLRSGAHRRSRGMPRAVLATHALMMGAMAVDGFNSLLLDLRLPHPYEPSNLLRLVTGMLAGIVLAVALTYLSAITFWRAPDRGRAPLERPRDLLPVLAIQIPAMVLVTQGPGWLYVPVSLLLIVCALAVVGWLALICLVLLARRDFAFTTMRELEPLAARALVVGIVVMGILASGRALVERLSGPSPLT